MCFPGYNSRKEFIAAQGPLPGTVNEFWRMIWEKNVQTLVMLTRCNEQGRVKCEEYYPSETKHFENITVTTTSEIPLEDWTIRDFDIKNVKTVETRSVRHFHFTAWPDHGVPETTELLINFRHLVREHMDQYSRHSPTIVHCRYTHTHTHTHTHWFKKSINISSLSLLSLLSLPLALSLLSPSCSLSVISTLSLLLSLSSLSFLLSLCHLLSLPLALSLSPLSLSVSLSPQCGCGSYRHLHSHRPADLPDRKGEYGGRVRHHP
uniref:Tyrosine-protein phosphatase domain-containing protein n=1 Tax=Hucho hucho TaxID=62062 RepID=A0A4W5JX40_9TELE